MTLDPAPLVTPADALRYSDLGDGNRVVREDTENGVRLLVPPPSGIRRWAVYFCSTNGVPILLLAAAPLLALWIARESRTLAFVFAALILFGVPGAVRVILRTRRLATLFEVSEGRLTVVDVLGRRFEWAPGDAYYFELALAVMTIVRPGGKGVRIALPLTRREIRWLVNTLKQVLSVDKRIRS